MGITARQDSKALRQCASLSCDRCCKFSEGWEDLRGTLRIRGTLRAAAILLLATGLCASESMWGQQATLVGDAHVSSAQPTVNAGTLSNLNVGGGYTALVQFDLGTLPAGTTPAQIAKATLRVYCNRADVPGMVQAELVGGAWTESRCNLRDAAAGGCTVTDGAGDGGRGVCDVRCDVGGAGMGGGAGDQLWAGADCREWGGGAVRQQGE